jgi:hypothetical protein
MHRSAIKEKKAFYWRNGSTFFRILLTGRQTISWRWLSVATSTSGTQKTVGLIEIAVLTYRLQTCTSRINLHRDIVSRKVCWLGYFLISQDEFYNMADPYWLVTGHFIGEASLLRPQAMKARRTVVVTEHRRISWKYFFLWKVIECHRKLILLFKMCGCKAEISVTNICYDINWCHTFWPICMSQFFP